MTPTALPVQDVGDLFAVPQSIPVKFKPGSFTHPPSWSAATKFESAWAWESVNKLNTLSQLRTGWDTYGSIPPTQVAISTAIALIEKMSFQDKLVAGQTPKIAPVSGGALLISLTRGTREYELAISPSGSLTVLATDTDHEQELSLPLPDDQLLTWLAHWIS